MSYGLQSAVALIVSKETIATTNLTLQGKVSGGAYRDRTDDPLLAKQVLSQLS